MLERLLCMQEIRGSIPHISKINLFIIKYVISFQFFFIHDMLSSDISSFSLLLMMENLGFGDARIVRM